MYIYIIVVLVMHARHFMGDLIERKQSTYPVQISSSITWGCFLEYSHKIQMHIAFEVLYAEA